MLTPKKFASNILPWLILGVIAILYSIFAYLVPLAIDDYMYVERWGKASDWGDFSIEAYIKFIKHNRAVDNFRISNIFAPFAVSLQPIKSIAPVITGLCMSGIVFMSGAFASNGQRVNQALLYSVIWLCMIVFLPWSVLFVADYALNYIWAAAITLLALTLLFKAIREGASSGIYILSLITVFIAGGWHEGFAIPTLVGLGLFAISRQFKLPSKFYILFSVYLISTLFFFLSPGTFRRVEREMGGIALNQPIDGLILLVIILLSILVCSISKSGRSKIKKTFHTPICLIGLGIIPIGYLMGLLTESPPRCYFWPNLVGVIILVSFIVNAVSSNWKNWVSNTVCILILGFCIIQSLLCITLQYQLYKENKEILHLFNESETGIIYYDIHTPNKLSWFYKEMPVINVWKMDWQYMVFYECLRKGFCCIVPSELEDLDFAQLRLIHTNPNFYQHKGYLLSENYLTSEYSEYNFGVDELKMAEPNELPFDVGDYKKGAEFHTTPFLTKPYLHKDNKIYPDTLLYYEQR